MQRLNFKNNRILLMIILGFASSSLIISCAQKRDAKLPEDVAQNIFSKAQFEDKDVEILVDNSSERLTSKDNLDSTTKNEYHLKSNVIYGKAVSSDSDPQIDFMFKNLKIENISGESKAKIKLRITKDYITGFRVSGAGSNLPRTLKAVSIVEGAQVLIPVFKYKIEAYGLLKAKKNELSQETSTLNLVPCDWEDATHVKISSISDARLMVHSPFNKLSAQSLYEYAQLAAKTFSLNQLKEIFNLSVDELSTSHSDDQMVMKITQKDTMSLVNKDGEIVGHFAVHCVKSNLSALAPGEDFEPQLEMIESPCDETHLNDNIVQISSGLTIQKVEP